MFKSLAGRRRAALIPLAAALLLQPIAPLQAQVNRLPRDTPNLPHLGDGQTMSLSAERRLGDHMARAIFRDPDYLDDPVLGDYLASLWRPLIEAAQRRGELSPEMAERFAWRLMISRDNTVNAFAMPGGNLGVHLGLIAMTANADELASVLAHELTHVTQRHIARNIDKQSQQAPLLLAGMLLGILAASAANNADIGGAAIAGGQALAVQNQLNFSRDMEREADRVGFGVMRDAGFEGQGFVTMFERLQQSARLNDDGGFPYLRSHPLTTERMADMRARLPMHDHASHRGQPHGHSTSPHNAWMHALMAARARVLAEAGADRQRVRPDEHQATATTGDGPTRAARHYATALAALKQRNLNTAINATEALLQQPGLDASALPVAEALAVEVLLQAPADQRIGGQPLPAWADRLATRGTRTGLLMAAQAARAGGQPAAMARASERLLTWVTERPTDALAWQTLATLYRAQNQALRAVRADAEAQVAMLDYPGAIDRFKSAQNLARSQPQADHFELSILDARTREIMRLQTDIERDAAEQRGGR
ncbi:M48 family metalloprotease [Hydrogenophaga atypica]|uniref:M48 family metalloprotease n=1 Tax=Hydrogenophaga atypica TaxID=249409 RepID=A0ABW2QEM8_9BURK